jgi:hypothetical protein
MTTTQLDQTVPARLRLLAKAIEQDEECPAFAFFMLDDNDEEMVSVMYGKHRMLELVGLMELRKLLIAIPPEELYE